MVVSGVVLVVAVVAVGVVVLRSGAAAASPATTITTALQGHAKRVEVVGDGRLLHDLQARVADEVLEAVVKQDGPLLRDNLVPHGQLELQLLNRQILALHDAVVDDSALLEFHVVELKLADPATSEARRQRRGCLWR